MKIFNLLFATASISAENTKKRKTPIGQRQRFVRRLAVSSPALLNLETQELFFNNDHSGVKCLTRTGGYEEWEHPFIYEELAKVLVCQRWLTRVNNARRVLLEKWEIDLIEEEDLEAASRFTLTDSWNINEGPNARNTLIFMEQLCNEMVQDSHLPYLTNACKNGYTTENGESLSADECRAKYDRKTIHKSRKACKIPLKNSTKNKKQQTKKLIG